MTMGPVRAVDLWDRKDFFFLTFTPNNQKRYSVAGFVLPCYGFRIETIDQHSIDSGLKRMSGRRGHSLLGPGVNMCGPHI